LSARLISLSGLRCACGGLAHARPAPGGWNVPEANFNTTPANSLPPGEIAADKDTFAGSQRGHYQSQNASAEMGYNLSIGYVRPKVSREFVASRKSVNPHLCKAVGIEAAAANPALGALRT
jgi:hypothetical protein